MSRRAGTSVRPSPQPTPTTQLQLHHPVFPLPGTPSDRWLTRDRAVAYALGIYLLNLFLAFLTPKFDPSNDEMDQDMEDGSAGGLPVKNDDEFKPFIRRLPEFKFWYWATRAVAISFACSWFELFNVPVFWPVLVMYWFILFFLTSELLPCRLQCGFLERGVEFANGARCVVRRQIQHMVRYRYVPFTFGKKNYNKNSS